MSATISDAARNLAKLASEADDVRAKLAAKASELGLLTQQLFVIEQAMQTVISDLKTCDLYPKGPK